MKLVYLYDDKKIFTGTKLIEDTAEIPENATIVEPVNSDGTSMYEPITWDGSSWHGVTAEEYSKAHTVIEIDEPTDFDKRDAASIAHMAEQDKLNSQLIAQIAVLQKGSN